MNSTDSRAVVFPFFGKNAEVSSDALVPKLAKRPIQFIQAVGVHYWRLLPLIIQLLVPERPDLNLDDTTFCTRSALTTQLG